LPTALLAFIPMSNNFIILVNSASGCLFANKPPQHSASLYRSSDSNFVTPAKNFENATH